MSILTDEEILKASQVEMFLPNGDLDPDCGYLRGRQQVADAEHKATLKAVGEMLEEVIPPNEIEKVISPDMEWTWHCVIETFLRGEMPKEGEEYLDERDSKEDGK